MIRNKKLYEDEQRAREFCLFANLMEEVLFKVYPIIEKSLGKKAGSGLIKRLNEELKPLGVTARLLPIYPYFCQDMMQDIAFEAQEMKMEIIYPREIIRLYLDRETEKITAHNVRQVIRELIVDRTKYLAMTNFCEV